jgi:hypothetical protein
LSAVCYGLRLPVRAGAPRKGTTSRLPIVLPRAGARLEVPADLA